MNPIENALASRSRRWTANARFDVASAICLCFCAFLLQACAGVPVSSISPTVVAAQPTPTLPQATAVPETLDAAAPTILPAQIVREPITASNAERVRQLAWVGQGTANKVAWSPDGKLIAVASSYGVYLYDAARRQQVALLKHPARVWSLAFSHDGNIVGTGAGDSVARLWRVSDHSLMSELEGHRNAISAVAFSPDGKWFATASLDETARLWQLGDATLAFELSGHDSVLNDITFTPDSQFVATAGDRSWRTWRVSDGKLSRMIEQPLGAATAVAFSPDGSLIAMGSSGGEVAIRHAEGGAMVAYIKADAQSIERVAFAPDGKYLVSGGADRVIKLWQVSDGQLVREFKGHTNGITSLAFNPDGTQFVSSGADDTVRVWNVSDGSPIATLGEFTGDFFSVALNAEGTHAAAGSDHGDIWLWTVGEETPRVVRTDLWNVFTLAFNGGLSVVAGGIDGKVVLVDSVTMQIAREFTVDTSAVNSLAISADDKLLATVSGANVKLWRMDNFEPVWAQAHASGLVDSVAFNSGGTLIASAGTEGMVNLWDATNGKLIRSWDVGSAVKGLAFSPDGAMLAAGSILGDVKLWRVEDGELLHEFKSMPDSLRTMTFNRDGSLLITAGQGIVRLWQFQEPKLLNELKGHTGFEARAALSRDGTTLASVSDDGTLSVWGVK